MGNSLRHERIPEVTDWTCDCSEDFGPCELHCDVLVSREGASMRSADELSALFVDDVADLDVPVPADVFVTLASLRWDGVWLADDGTGDSADALEWARQAAEDQLGAAGLRVEWNDGYQIYRVTGGPLSDSSGPIDGHWRDIVED